MNSLIPITLIRLGRKYKLIAAHFHNVRNSRLHRNQTSSSDPLKGIILKDYYPKTTMRKMCDNDILLDKTQKYKVKKIMSDLEFKMKADDSGHDLEFVKAPVFNFEMHTELFCFGHESSMNDYYSDVKKRLLKDEDNDFGYHFSNEDFYVFMTAHERKHFYYCGTGLRSLVDTYVFLNHFKDELDREYIDSELRALGINDYEKKSTGLSKNCSMEIR